MNNDFAQAVELVLCRPTVAREQLNAAILTKTAVPTLSLLARHPKLGAFAQDSLGVLAAEREATAAQTVTMAVRPGEVRTLSTEALTLTRQ